MAEKLPYEPLGMLLTAVRLVMPAGPSPLTTAFVTFKMVTETPGADTMLMTSVPCVMSQVIMLLPRINMNAFCMSALL